jgi:hypothetical protein
MSDLSLTRISAFTTILALAATSLIAANPSARYETRMAYNASTTHMILFGGATAVDKGTKQSYVLGDTWEWTGARWIQRFPSHAPSARSGHVLVYDSNRDQIVLFGGRDGKIDLNDTWIYKNGDWTEVNTPNSPPARLLAGAAYDPIRDRIVLAGGTKFSADGKTLTAVHDTWEFDGTTWTQISGAANAGKPILAYDAAHDQMLMLAQTDALAPQMYTYDPAAGAWNQVNNTTLPPCVNEGQMTYQSSTTQTVIYTGGVCTNTISSVDDTYEWDGSNWNKVEVVSGTIRLFGAALAFDDNRQSAVLFGGTPPLGNPVADTWIFGNKTWVPVIDPSRPGPRSLFAFATDPVNNTIWMLGGIDEVNTLGDFWKYQSGAWESVTADGTPASCSTPNSAYDTNRQKLVVVCADSGTFEWDGAAWKPAAGLKTVPPARRFSSMAYDPNLKKIVLFGGFNDLSYVDETWLWDGTEWTRQKKNPAPARSLASMWFDPNLKKIVIYGGIGRVTTTDRITRFSDMWTFDGNGWAELKPSGGTPGSRYGAQATVDPRSDHVLLFGGLRVDTPPPVPPATTSTDVQVYANDTWEWDGSVWKRLSTDGLPPPRENGAMAFDPTRNEIVMFGGYAGAFLSDLWSFTPNHWQVKILDPEGGRRRVAP